MSTNNRIKGVVLVAGMVLGLGPMGCGGEGAHIEGLFEISAKPVTLSDESPGLQFFAKTSTDVDVFKVVITPPTGENLLIEGKNTTVYEGQVIQLQEDDMAFYRISGQWTFRFVGNLARGNRDSFDIIETVAVGL